MKNKGLIATIAVIALILVGVFAYQAGQMKPTEKTAKTETKTVGILQYVSHPALDQIKKGVVAGLKAGGYKEKDNLKIEFQNGQADQSKLATMSQQLVEKNSDVLVGIATPAAQALANTTQDTPIILGAVTDPVGANLVKSMKKPGANITGVSDQAPVAGILKLAKQLLPNAKTVGVLYSSTEDNSKAQVEQAEAAAKTLGLTIKKYAVPSTNEVAQTVQVMSGETDFIFIPNDNTIANAMQTVVQEANKSQKAIFPCVDTMVEQGGVATVGINQYNLGVATGKMAAKVLDGKDPGSMPIETFNTGDTVINEKQAAKLGITIPDSVKKDATVVGED
jgi:putative ABC transport system substrate-binding protein